MLDMETTHMENYDPDDPAAAYILEASKVERLTKMEETKLFRELGHRGDFDEHKDNALRRLVESHLMLSVSIARKHLAAGVPVLELMQEANVGLVKAVMSFAERPIGDFTVRAAACIEDAIKRYLAESKPRSSA
jgi:DNA-directed RNA polymerase sigma subunit (sigma70/sigma32)